MNQVKLSIIIPVYNLEGFIEETLDSCINQDMSESDYEIICVDDGSKDKSAEIIENYRTKHNNVVLIKKENGGVSSARNKGIEVAKGEYIWFVDGDDIIAPDCLNFLYSSIKKTNGDLLWFKMVHFKDKPIINSIHQANLITCDDQNKKYEFMSSNGNGGVCIIIFKSEVLKANNIRFNEKIKYSEDVLFCFEVIIASSRFAKTDATCYYYRQREGSAMHSNNMDLHIDSMEKLAETYNSLAFKYDNSVKSILADRRDYAIKAMLFSMVRKGNISEAKTRISELEKKGLYPYHFKYKLLIGNETVKQFIINGISFLFPFKWYFMLCVRILSLKKKKWSK